MAKCLGRLFLDLKVSRVREDESRGDIDPGIEAELLIRNTVPLMLLEVSLGSSAGTKLDKLSDV